MAPPIVPDPNVKTVDELRPKFGPEITRSKSFSPETWCNPIFVQVDGVPAISWRGQTAKPFSKTQSSWDCCFEEVVPVLGS
jgi:hypothetical protein